MLHRFLIAAILLIALIFTAGQAVAAFPVIDAVGGYSEQTSDTTTHTLTPPSSLAAGNLLVCILGLHGNPTLSAIPWSLTQLNRTLCLTAGFCTAEVYYKFASGSESSSTYTSSAAETSTNLCFRVTGAHASTPPEIATAQIDNANHPNPPSLNPTGWDVEDTRWLAAFIRRIFDDPVTTYPTDYADNQFNDGSGGTSDFTAIGTASRALAAASDNPAIFEIALSSDESVGITMAFRPAAAASFVPRRSARILR